jgi:putative ATP-dependent endonuclease of OLD family
MRLIGVRVKNYRTVGTQEQVLDLVQTLTLIGPNNSGKTNLLHAIQLLFTGYDNIHGYEVAADSPQGRGARTSIVGYFRGDDSGDDVAFYRDLDRLYSMYKLTRRDTGIALYLTFSESGNPTYTFFPNQKRPTDRSVQASISKVQRQLVNELLERINCHFIPSEKSMRELIDDVLTPFIRSVIVQVLTPRIEDIQAELDNVSSNITDALIASGVDGISASFGFEGGSIERFLSGFDFYLSDPYKTPLARKGQGMQSLAFMAALLWVTQQEASLKKESVWLIGEPESFLHPKLSHNATQLIDSLGKASTVVLTSHSMAFVPHDPRRVVGTRLDEGSTVIDVFPSHEKATASLRRGLGLKFSDYFSLGTCTVLTEGQSNARYLAWFLEISNDWPRCAWDELWTATLSDRGGASELAGFLRSIYEILRNEQPAVSLFDADDAGVKAVSGLSRYFNNINVEFNSNREYVYVRSGFAIEGLFPDGWIKNIYSTNPEWFVDYQVDASGDMVKFRIMDNKKDTVGNILKARADTGHGREWATRWIDVCQALDQALQIQRSRLETF